MYNVLCETCAVRCIADGEECKIAFSPYANIRVTKKNLQEVAHLSHSVVRMTQTQETSSRVGNKTELYLNQT